MLQCEQEESTFKISFTSITRMCYANSWLMTSNPVKKDKQAAVEMFCQTCGSTPCSTHHTLWKDECPFRKLYLSLKHVGNDY